MKDLKRNLKMKKFLAENKKDVEALNKTFFDLFNKLGKETKDGGAQVAFTGAIILFFFKNINVEKTVKKSMLLDMVKMVEKGKA